MFPTLRKSPMPVCFYALRIVSLDLPDFLNRLRLLQPNLVLPPRSIIGASDFVEAS